MDKVIFIDRDGVINVDLIGDYIKTWDEFQFETGAVRALKSLVDHHFKIVIISNQAGVGDGIFTKEDLDDIQAEMIKELAFEGIQITATHYCLHGKNEGCNCRKPKTGLLEVASKDLVYDPAVTFFIGDKATDIQAGITYGLKTIFVRTGHGKTDEDKFNDTFMPTYRANNLEEAIRKFVL